MPVKSEKGPVVTSVCMSYRHDFGLLPPEHRQRLMQEALRWREAWQKEATPAPDLSKRVAELEDALSQSEANVEKWAKTATDRRYMMDSYRQMLGPKGLEVAAMWETVGVVRQHTSWGPEAWKMTGEERAQCLLDVEAAPKRLMLPGELDGGTREKVDVREWVSALQLKPRDEGEG